MITAVDTNVLLDILIPNESFYDASAEALQTSAQDGSLVISDIVYAELCVHFAHQRECDAFLDALDIRVQCLSREAHFLASRVWPTYREQGGKRTRILADFLIGSHAQMQASRLCLVIVGFTGSCFRRLPCYSHS
jgi:predicted nucleic acid-binding protein